MFKTLLKSVREFKRPAILTPIFVAVEVVADVLIPYTIAELVNQIKSGCELMTIVWYGLALIGMAIIAVITGWAAGTTCARASTGFARNLRKDMFYNIQNFSFANVDKFSTSSLVTRLTTDRKSVV